MGASRPLDEYRARRDFELTREPGERGRPAKSSRPRFVVQKHAARRLHYDLRLELDGVFRSWAVPRGPSADPGEKRLAVEVEDHPLAYGDFEGTIPAGQYGGGTVQIWDRGFWQPSGDEPPSRSLERGHLKFELEGERLGGGWALIRTSGADESGQRRNWLLLKHRDAHARPGDILRRATRSVASGRTMAEITAGKGDAPEPFMAVEEGWPEFIEPQLCRLSQHAPEGEGWGHEIKFDGYRMQLRHTKGITRLLSRRGLDWTDRFPGLAAAAARLPPLIADGEVVALDADRTPSFTALTTALSAGDPDRLVYFVFDLMFEQGDMRRRPLHERKQRLAALVAELPAAAAKRIRYVEHFETGGDAILRSACRLSLEGIVSKRLDAPYRSGRGPDWLKTKCRGGQEVVIGGWREENGRFRSLLAGLHRGGQLEYVGRIGTGFSESNVPPLHRRLKELETRKSPFSGPVPAGAALGARWAKPVLVAEIGYAGFTGGGMIRQASFKGLREDKPAGEVGDEILAPVERAGTKKRRTRAQAPEQDNRVMGVALSSPDKVLWPKTADTPALTKLDLARYLENVAPRLMPHIDGRPCSIVRAPDGIDGQRFFQRHAMAGTSSLLTLTKVRRERKPYLQVDRPEALAALAQLAALELHPWNSLPGKPEVPGRLVFDLDPGPGVDFADVIAAALEIRERLEAVGLDGWCKTTGGKGLHVVAALAPERNPPDWDFAKEFAHHLCRQMAADTPDRYVVTMARQRREGRIFLDYLRNGRAATAVAPLSPRARPGATVSMPLRWRDVHPTLNPARYTLTTVPPMLCRADPWADYADSARALRPADRRLRGAARRGSGASRDSHDAGKADTPAGRPEGSGAGRSEAKRRRKE